MYGILLNVLTGRGIVVTVFRMKFDNECVYPELLFTVKIRYQIYSELEMQKNTSPDSLFFNSSTPKIIPVITGSLETAFRRKVSLLMRALLLYSVVGCLAYKAKS